MGGWEPSTTSTAVTTYVYDDDGRLLSAATQTVTEAEPEFDDLDRGWVEALLDLRANQCKCGGQLTETTDKAFVWTAEPDTLCNRCYALTYKQWLQANAKRPGAPTGEELEQAKRAALNAARLWHSERVPVNPPT